MNLSIPLDLNRLISLSRSLPLSPSLDLSIPLSHTISLSSYLRTHYLLSFSAICAIRRRETLTLPWKSSLGALKCSRHLSAMSISFILLSFLSLALVARQNNYVRPTLTTEDLLDIQNGRHVLQEMTVDTFIPNDTKIHDDGRINIITGPNYSGKSIYIKQVALIVFLSHIRSFIPADAATVGLTDRIFCAMGSKFMNAEQSTFMIDLHQVGMMLRHATSRSLCLLDEFGKGTLTEDGTGLLGGTINHFITCYDPPKVLVCTHLTEMFNDSCIQESDNIKYYTMSVLQPNDGIDIEDIVFLYRYVYLLTMLRRALR